MTRQMDKKAWCMYFIYAIYLKSNKCHVYIHTYNLHLKSNLHESSANRFHGKRIKLNCSTASHWKTNKFILSLAADSNWYLGRTQSICDTVFSLYALLCCQSVFRDFQSHYLEQPRKSTHCYFFLILFLTYLCFCPSLCVTALNCTLCLFAAQNSACFHSFSLDCLIISFGTFHITLWEPVTNSSFPIFPYMPFAGLQICSLVNQTLYYSLHCCLEVEHSDPSCQTEMTIKAIFFSGISPEGTFLIQYACNCKKTISI